MNKRIQKIIAMFALVAILASFVVLPTEVSAANDFYGDYTDVAKVYDYGSCPSIQGVAVGSQKMYAVKINGTDDKAFITMADKDTGATTKLYNADAGSYFFDYFGHANDMDVWGIDGYSNIFVTTTNKGTNGIIRLKRDGDNLTKVANYRLQCDGEDICATAMAITGVSDGKIHFITKWVMQLYTGSVDVNATSATIKMEKLCSITKERVYIKGSYVDLSNYVNQGMGYHDGTLFVPISGDDNNLNRSVIMVFDLNNATKGSTVYPTEALVFRVTSGAYSALFELESCDICTGDKKLYFSVQRRVSNSDTDHDGIASFDDYTYERLPVDAPTSDPNTSGSGSGTTTTQTYTVRYDANGGTGTMADTVVTYGTSTALRTNSFTRNGWSFAGWHAYRTSDNKWYYTNGSTYAWYTEGSQPSGYYKDTYNDGVSVAKTSNVNGDVVIMYAQWTALDITYTVRYNANGGSGTMADTIVVYGYNTPLSLNTFTKTGYKFAGWNAYRTAKNQWYYTDGTNSGWYTEGGQPDGYYLHTYRDGVNVAKTTSTANDIAIMYAVWEPITYTIEYDANGGTGTMANTTVTWGVNTPLRANTFTRTGYTFNGWYAKRASDNKWFYTDGTNSSWYLEGSQPDGYYKSNYRDTVNVAKTSNVDGDLVTMYAQWLGSDYSVTFKNADGTVLKSETVTAGTVPTAPSAPTKAYDSTYHYTFNGWDKALTAVTGDTTYTATYTATAHSYSSNVTQSATCTAQGTKTYTCTCGHSYTEKIASTGHSYKSTVVGSTCTTGGYTVYTCTSCGDSYQGNPTAAAGHSYNATVIEPTCTTGGYTIYTCSGCGSSYQGNTTAAAGHSYKTTVIDPTCTTGGYTTSRCTICGDVVQGSETSALGHDYSAVVTAPTCTNQGYTTYTCKVCGSSYVGGYVDAIGHSYSSKVTAPTCTAGGYTTYTCTGCGHSYKDQITNATGHNYKATVIAPTCTTAGYTTYLCACGDTYTGNATAATGHSFANGICGTCGEVDPNYSPAVVIPTLALKAPTLEFKDMITVNAMFEASNLDDVVEMGMITYSYKATEWSVETAEYVIPGTTYDASTGRYIATSQGIHAKYLGDTVYLACYAKLTDGTYAYSKLAGYSPVQYATSKLKGTDVPLKQLVVAMLNYGAAAQVHFNHNVDNLANATLTADQIALPETYRSDMVSTVASPSTDKQGAFVNNKGFAKRYPSISFEGAFCINYFFTPYYAPVDGITLYYWNAEDYNAASVLSISNATGSMKLEGSGTGEYRGDITGIAAKALSEATYVAAVYSDGTNTWTSGVLGYSIGAYCSSQATKGGTIADLAMATAVYGYQAKQYFN